MFSSGQKRWHCKNKTVPNKGRTLSRGTVFLKGEEL